MQNVALNTSNNSRGELRSSSFQATHTIRSGDTLGSIAQRFGVSVDQLLKANPQISNPNMIYPGDSLTIPQGNTYTVQSGDTIGQIAQRYGTSVDAIASANGVSNPSLIYPGDSLVIPVGSARGETASAPSSYTIQPGDTLGQIASRFGTSAEALAQANGITNPNRIFPGDTLSIPGGGSATSGGASSNTGVPTDAANDSSPTNGVGASVTPGQLPDTTALNQSQKYDLYAGYINEFGSATAQQQLADGQKVVLSLRVDTSTNVNSGKGQYDDRMVVVWQSADGSKHAQEFSANTDPSGQYEHRGQFERKAMGVDYNGDGRLDQGRLADGTYQYSRGNFMNADAFLARGDQVAQRDVNHNGLFDDSASSPRGNYGMHIHIGGSNNTYSAGCFTMAPDAHAAFFNTIGGQSSLTNVVVNTNRLSASETAGGNPTASDTNTSGVTESGLPTNSDPATRAMTEADFQRAANDLGVDVAVIKAVADVEAAGSGFLADGRPKILFEAHWFGEFTGDQYNSSHPDISSARWNRSLYEGGAGEYSRLEQAMSLNDEAALKSASWGKFQIMGFNHEAAGYSNVKDFVQAMFESEGKQLDAFVNFIESNPSMHRALQNHDWATFAYHYNGEGYAANNYDVKLAQAYARHSQ